MVAQCPACSNTFFAEEGRLAVCPACGAALPPTPVVPPLPMPRAPPAPVPVVRALPWADRATVGVWRALTRTVTAVLVEPQHYLPHTDWTRVTGAGLYYALVALVPAAVSEVIDALRNRPFAWVASLDQLFQTMDAGGETTLPAPHELDLLHRVADRPVLATVLIVLLTVAQARLRLWSTAAGTHWLLKVMRLDKAPYEATWNALAFADTPRVLELVPICGGTIAYVWSLVLGTYVVMRVHRLPPMGAVAVMIVIPFAALATFAVVMGLGAFLAAKLLFGPMSLPI